MFLYLGQGVEGIPDNESIEQLSTIAPFHLIVEALLSVAKNMGVEKIQISSTVNPNELDRLFEQQFKEDDNGKASNDLDESGMPFTYEFVIQGPDWNMVQEQEEHSTNNEPFERYDRDTAMRLMKKEQPLVYLSRTLRSSPEAYMMRSLRHTFARSMRDSFARTTRPDDTDNYFYKTARNPEFNHFIFCTPVSANDNNSEAMKSKRKGYLIRSLRSTQTEHFSRSIKPDDYFSRFVRAVRSFNRLMISDKNRYFSRAVRKSSPNYFCRAVKSKRGEIFSRLLRSSQKGHFGTSIKSEPTVYFSRPVRSKGKIVRIMRSDMNNYFSSGMREESKDYFSRAVESNVYNYLGRSLRSLPNASIMPNHDLTRHLSRQIRAAGSVVRLMK